MYEKPRVERFGTLREITQAGFGSVGDGLFTHLRANGGS